ncbi:MAG: serine hydrolase [Patescibacteria group bacterium]|jgi:beta-lactamase class A
MNKNNVTREQISFKKPWHKDWVKIFLIVLLLSNLATIGILINKNKLAKQLQEAKKYPLLDFSRNFIDQDNFLSSIEPIRKSMKEAVAKYEAQGNRISVYFEFLNTGANISINQEERFWPASLSKMPTALAVMKKVENGEWKLSNELVLFAEDQDSRFGDIYLKTPGTRFTIEELLKETLINSDNTAHKILVRNLSSEDYTKSFEALGLEELYDDNYDITAKEYSRIFRALYSASYLNRDNSQKLLSWLTQTSFDEFIGSGIPTTTLFAHKIGEEYKEVVFLDSGIFYVAGRPCLITVMAEVKDGGGVGSAQKIMGELSKIAYDYVANK